MPLKMLLVLPTVVNECSRKKNELLGTIGNFLYCISEKKRRPTELSVLNRGEAVDNKSTHVNSGWCKRDLGATWNPMILTKTTVVIGKRQHHLLRISSVHGRPTYGGSKLWSDEKAYV